MGPVTVGDVEGRFRVDFSLPRIAAGAPRGQAFPEGLSSERYDQKSEQHDEPRSVDCPCLNGLALQVLDAMNLGTCDYPVTTACAPLGAVTVLGVVVPYSIPGVASPAERGRPRAAGHASQPKSSFLPVA